MIRTILATLSLAVLATFASAQNPNIAGRWSFVTLNDTTTQLNNMGGPTEFDTVLDQSSKTITNPTGIHAGTDTSYCDNAATSGEGNIKVTGTANSGTNGIVLTFDVNKGVSGSVEFKYIFTGTYTTNYERTGSHGSSTTLTAISGTYTTSGCSSAEASGTFVATYFPAINSVYTGFLDAPDDGPAVNGTNPATIYLDASGDGSSVTGWYAANSNGTGAPSLSNPQTGQACFVGPVTFSSSLSYVGGLAYSVFGTDSAGRQLWFNMYNSNPADNGTTTFSQAAVGIDTPNSGNSGISNDGTNNQITVYYGISGGPCDGAGGGDAPFVPVKVKQHKEKPRNPRHRHDDDRR